MTKSKPIIYTSTGVKFDIFDPDLDDIRIEDIAHALSNVCRYGGHSKEHYSVAQHSCIVSDYCSPENKLWGLLHDASEAYIGDVVAPLKHTEEFEFYLKVEEDLMNLVCEKFGLEYEAPEEIKYWDLVIRSTEIRDISSIPLYLIDRNYPPTDKIIHPLNPKESKERFLLKFHQLNLRKLDW